MPVKGAHNGADTGAHNGPNPELREYLRQWRRDAAAHQGLPAFTVMYDSTLDEICRVLPTSLSDIRRISGFGDRKTEAYGQQVLDALQRFRTGARAVKPQPALRSSRRKRLPAAAFLGGPAMGRLPKGI